MRFCEAITLGKTSRHIFLTFLFSNTNHIGCGAVMRNCQLAQSDHPSSIRAFVTTKKDPTCFMHDDDKKRNSPFFGFPFNAQNSSIAVFVTGPMNGFASFGT